MEVYKPSQKNTRCGISYSISIAIATYSQTSLSQGVMKCDLMLMLGRQMAIFFLLGCRSVNRNERDIWSLNAPWMTFFLCARSVISGTEVESLTSPNGGFNSWQAMIWCNNLISRHQVYILCVALMLQKSSQVLLFFSDHVGPYINKLVLPNLLSAIFIRFPQDSAISVFSGYSTRMKQSFPTNVDLASWSSSVL